MHLVALQCVLVITGFLCGGGGQALTITRDQDETNPPVEYVEVTEGDTLSMSCALPENSGQRDVHWGKNSTRNRPLKWLTQDSAVETDDSRVSLNAGWGDYTPYHFIYSIHISHITNEDSGKYICYVAWGNYKYYTDREGYVYVSVRNFPKEQPVCSTNQTANSTSDGVYLWCDTMQGYPGVNVTWTVDGTGDDEILNSSVVDNESGQERVRMELRLISTFWGNHWTKEFVCTVTSSAFPGLENTCSVNITVERPVTTEAYFDGNVPSTGTDSPDSGSPDSGSPDSGSPDSGSPDSGSPDSGYPDSGSPDSGSLGADNKLAITLGIPALFIALFILLICVLKRTRQRKSRRGRNTKRTTSPIGPNKDRGGEVVVPYSVKQLQINDYDADISNSANNPGTPITGEERNVSPRAGQFDLTCRPYSVTRQQQKQTVDSGVDFSSSAHESYQPAAGGVELDLNGESAVYSQIPDESTKRDFKGQRSNTHKSAQSEHPEEPQEDNSGYEPLNLDRKGSGTSMPKIKTNLSRKDHSQAPQTFRHADEFQGVDDHFMNDESVEGIVINPIYEPFGNGEGQDGVHAKPTKRDFNGQRSSTDCGMVQSEHPAEHREDNYDVLNMDRTCSSTSAQTNSSQNGSSRAPHTEEFGGVDDHFMTDESEEGTVVNPIYEPLGKGQDGALAKPGPQADESRIYQMIN